MKSSAFVVCVFFLFLNTVSSAQSTSPNPQYPLSISHSLIGKISKDSEASEVITFSEYALETVINAQYRDKGIIFSGSGPFISSDGANPTSPVLSGTPRFMGDIIGTFVEPGTDNPTVVNSFTFDCGYFDNFGSTRIEWFDPDGNKLGQKINSILGIEQMTFEGGNIASWQIEIIEDEPAGFGIDNVFFVPVGASVLFRENSDDYKEGTWGFKKDEIPGFDHTAFEMGSVVYESHPGYTDGTYMSGDGEETKTIRKINGVQSEHCLATFKHDSKTDVSPVIEFKQIPVSNELATEMRKAIESVRGSQFQFIDYSLSGLEATLAPSAQKGGDGTFTCVGLVEWAAEQAGYNNGEGFIRNNFESFTIPHDLFEVPLLSPQLLYYSMRSQQVLFDASQWIQGLLDPVDFILTDPLGREAGFDQKKGLINQIPNMFYSGDGGVEQFLITNAIPGIYTIELLGLDADVFAAIGCLGESTSFNNYLPIGVKGILRIYVAPKPNTGGDVDGDSDVDEDDIEALTDQLNRYTDGLGHPGDLDGDGKLSNADVELLTDLVEILAEGQPDWECEGNYIVPDMVGKTPDEASAELSSNCLSVGETVYDCSNDVAEGTIIRTEPAAGSSASAAGTVKLVVCDGKCPFCGCCNSSSKSLNTLLGDWLMIGLALITLLVLSSRIKR